MPTNLNIEGKTCIFMFARTNLKILPNVARSVSVTFKNSARKIKFGQVSPKLAKDKDLALGGSVTKEVTCLINGPGVAGAVLWTHLSLID